MINRLNLGSHYPPTKRLVIAQIQISDMATMVAFRNCVGPNRLGFRQVSGHCAVLQAQVGVLC